METQEAGTAQGATFAPTASPWPCNRGLDAGLAKMPPDLRSLKKESYRTQRKKILLFAKACERRGQEAISEGAMSLFQSLDGLA